MAQKSQKSSDRTHKASANRSRARIHTGRSGKGAGSRKKTAAEGIQTMERERNDANRGAASAKESIEGSSSRGASSRGSARSVARRSTSSKRTTKRQTPRGKSGRGESST